MSIDAKKTIRGVMEAWGLTTHNLKIIDPYFSQVVRGEKTWELRTNDRDFQVGDRIRLHEHMTTDSPPTGRTAVVLIVGIHHPAEHIPIPPGKVLISIQPPPPINLFTPPLSPS